jgi:extracellular factor (EF) 3-hydroxypalmitic acid methyl ester biosynthesis protein
MRAFLSDLSRWLDQMEAVNTDLPRNSALQNEFCEEVESPLGPRIDELFGAFEREAAQVEPENIVAHAAFARQELHPLTLCSPFVHRTFTKPLGYAGDYEMVNMMLRNPREGGNTYARLVNSFNIRSAPAMAHRNRIDMLLERLVSETGRVTAAGGGPLKILNVGCGPAMEVQQFIRTSPLSEKVELNLLDFNAETLGYTKERIAESVRASGRKVSVEFIHKSVDDLLKEAAGLRESSSTAYGMVYCAGLFDYLSHRTCKRLLQLFANWTLPGGFIVATNVHANNPVRFYMEHLLEWHLIYRDEAGMASLAPPGVDSKVVLDTTGINVFIDMRKPASAGG